MPRPVPALTAAPFTRSHLARVTEMLSILAAAVDEAAGGPIVAQLTVPPEPLDPDAEHALALRSGDDPTLLLRGLTVEPPFDGVAIVGRGTARAMLGAPTNDAPISPLVADGPSGVAFATVFHRSGANLTRVATDGGVVELLSTDGTQASGRFDDACRRALGLPTAPPAGSTHTLWTSLWLDELVGRSLLGELHDWDDAVLAHPAAHHLGRTEAADLRRPERLLTATDRLASLWTWADIRLAVTTGERSLPGIRNDDGEWFDDGSFSRAVHDELLDPTVALGLLGDALDGDAHQQLCQVIGILLVPEVWGTPTRDGPPS